ncbi:MAG: efflux RND transporter periplasmic adaptor subunit [Sulfurimonas sp.]
MKKILLGLILLLNFANAQEIYATFNVEPMQDAKLAFISSGIVNKVNVDIGSYVKKGEVLAQIENSDIKAMLDIATTALKYAKKDYERQLKIKELIDEAKFDSVANRYENAKNQLSYQRALYKKTFLRAPFNGVIYAKEIEEGDAVSGMMLKTVFKIQSKSKRKLILSFDQKSHRLIKVGDIFSYKVDGNPKTYQTKITKIYPRININNRKMSAQTSASGFLTGLFGDGYIKVSDK